MSGGVAAHAAARAAGTDSGGGRCREEDCRSRPEAAGSQRTEAGTRPDRTVQGPSAGRAAANTGRRDTRLEAAAGMSLAGRCLRQDMHWLAESHTGPAGMAEGWRCGATFNQSQHGLQKHRSPRNEGAAAAKERHRDLHRKPAAAAPVGLREGRARQGSDFGRDSCFRPE